jgi:hypothetical protein
MRIIPSTGGPKARRSLNPQRGGQVLGWGLGGGAWPPGERSAGRESIPRS